ncbi:MAG: helix-turn-helix domain-containing protein [Nocardioides sp.]
MQTSLPEKAPEELGEIIREARIRADLSAAEVARRAGVTKGTITRLELGQIASPRGENLRAIADVLGIPASDLYVTAEWIPEGELPTFTPYLRSKYRHLPAKAQRELEASFGDIAKKYGYDPKGPAPGEDET